MQQKKEPELVSGSKSKVPPILSQFCTFASLSEQKNITLKSASSAFGGGRNEHKDLYLTNTDKAPSTPVENSVFFQQRSFDLYQKTKKLYNTDKKVLQNLHSNGFQKLKYINNNTVVLYAPWNPTGNSRAGWDLAKEDSNTDKARLASKQGAYEKALANVDVWEYFGTFTLDASKQDRYDFHKSRDRFSKFLRRRGIKFLFVPERHKDGAWHFHALLSGEMKAHLAEFEGKALKNPYIARCLREGKEVRHCRAYSESFGYNTIEPIRDREACVNYMMKYVLKTFDDKDYERVSRRRYFASQGLKSPRVIMPYEIEFNDFEVSALSHYSEKVYLKRRNVPNWVYSNSSVVVVESPPFP